MTRNDSTANKKFIVVLRGPSAAIFREGKHFHAIDFPSTCGPVNIVYTTRWLKQDSNVTLPGHIWIEVSGTGNTLEEILVPFANAGLALLPILSFCTNVAIGEPDIELGFDNTEGTLERDYFQNYIPPESGVLHFCRHVNVEATTAVVRALIKHKESERLRRGANQYRVALDSWRLGRESLALAHLWMAIEAITKAKIRMECTARGLTSEQELADYLGVSKKELDLTIRKNFILEGDEECYSKAKDASDGFEHGYLDYAEVISKAKDVRHRTARYVRNAILQMTSINEDVHNVLTSDPFDKPLGYWPVAKYFRGKLVGAKENLAANGNAYPFMRWRSEINATSTTADGKFNVQFGETITQELGEGTTIKPGSFEAWQAE